MDEKVLSLYQVSCSADLFQVDLTGDCIADAATEWHVSRLIIGRQPCGRSFTLPVAKACFSRPNIVAFLGGLTPKRSLNFTFTVSMVSPE
jgi:hypothetical protein